MTNRLRIFLAALPLFLGIFLALLPTERLEAQQSFFNFSYNGPTSLPVGPTCSAMLQGNVPNPVVSSTVGANIITSVFDPVASGFEYDDIFTYNTTAHVFWFVEDDQGHSHTFEYFINFVDVSPPTFDLTGIFTPLQFSSIAEVPPPPTIPVADNCTAITNQTFTETPGPPLCESGTFTRTWTATDANNNTATFTQTIIIFKDSLPPQITGYPQDGAAPCEQLATAYPLWLANQIAVFNATDPSGIQSLSNNAPAVFPPGCKVPLTVTFKAVDNCNFQQNVFVTFSTSDTQGPMVVVPPKDTVAYCTQNDNEFLKLREWISTRAYSAATDACSPPLTFPMRIGANPVDSAQVEAAFLASFTENCGTAIIGNQSYNKVHGFVSVNFFVRDACGNETFMGNADFGAIDTLPPTIVGTNATEQCGGGNDQAALQSWINAHGNATVTEDCSNFTWTNFAYSTSDGQNGTGNFNVGPYPVVQPNNCTWFADLTFRATDDCGNSSTITLRWSIVDTQAPVISGLQPSITVYCPNPLPTFPAATLSDNCDASVAISFTRVFKDSLCDGSYTVLTTWIATDDCGNSSTATQDIFVRDTTRPVFTLVPDNRIFRCDTFVLPPVPVMGQNIMATDVCSPVVSISTATNSFQNPDPGVCGHYSYNIIRTFTATDQCGNTRTASQTIFVVDNLGPVPGGVLDSTALCSALLPFPLPEPLATDACSGPTAPPTNTGQTTVPGPCTGQYTVLVHWVANDVCGNTTTFNQVLNVVDTVAPTLMNIPANITVECDAIPDPPNPDSFNAMDNCAFGVLVNLLETEIRNPDTNSCAHWSDYIIVREWTATDDCGNARTYTQQIQIEDTTPPAIVPPDAMTFPNDPGDCGVSIVIPGPLSATDICSNQMRSAIISDTKPLVPDGPGNPSTTPVAPMDFNLVAPNSSPFSPVTGIPALRVTLVRADADGPTEGLIVRDENGAILDTAITDAHCGDKVNVINISANQLNAWLADGVAQFRVETTGVGALACNAICAGGGFVTIELEYTYASSPVAIDLQYSLNGGPLQNYPPPGPTFLPVGTHTVVYTATDCSGNSSTNATQITVNDVQPPSLASPANITVFTGQNNCEGKVTLPFPNITENCAMSSGQNLSSAILPLQFENDPNVGWVASDITLPIAGILPNAVGMGTLIIKHLGDNAQIGEFFNVYDEIGNLLGSTAQGTVAGECTSFNETHIPVTAAQINNWASTGGAFGSTFFYLESNRDPLNYTDFVSNCAPILPNGTDGISRVQAMLVFSNAVVNYTVTRPVNQFVATGSLTGGTTMLNLTPANYTVTYTTTDHVGLTGTASFQVTVRDTVKPKAMCQPTVIIQVNPTGLPPYTLLPATINNGSTDNCTPTANLMYAVSPNTINCTQAGSAVVATLTVTDTSGNSATCQTLVGVTNTPPTPSSPPVCENGTLQLFANPPSAGPFTYLWSGPNGYSNNIQNPTVTTNAMAIHNGSYCVTITGATGCTSSACVSVNLAILGITPVLSGNGTSFCPGQDVVLTTDSYSGQNVSYQWLVESSPVPIEIGTTSTPFFTLSNLPSGTFTYYVKVFANGCNTAFSNAFTITVHPTPPAAVNPSQIVRCEGQSITLHSTTPSTGGLSYSWTGPGGFTSANQSPLVTNNAVKAIHEGVYTLITTQNGCPSIPVTVTVTVNVKPPRPTISGNVNVCAGQTVNLVCDNLNAAQYVWTQPPPKPVVITSTNVLTITNVSASDEGLYTVLVSANGCFSDESFPIYLDVHQYPVVTASSNAPICKDSLLLLSATFSSAEPLTWTWTFPNTSQFFQQNLSVPNGESGVYQVVGSTSFGCASTATVTVNNVTPPLITVIGNDAPACCDGTTDAMLFSTVISDNPPLTYLWTGPPAFGTSTLPNPIIPDVCTPYNGSYTLVVKDVFGCPSLPATTAINIQAPPTTPILPTSIPPVCAGTHVSLAITNPVMGVSYRWSRPNGLGDTTTTTAVLEIPNAQVFHSGNYSVMAIAANGTCQSTVSNTVTLTVHPIPAAPVISSNAPVCEGATLMLTANGPPGLTYAWSGPSGFVSSAQNPTRSPVTTGMAGEYTLIVSQNNCSSVPVSLMVDVVPKPSQPLIATPVPRICIDRPPVGEFLNISNPVNGMLYTWQDAATGIILAGPGTASQLNLDNVLWLGAGTHTFRVFATTPLLAGCESPFSNVVSVVFDTIPTNMNAFAGLDHFACASNPITLSATPPTGSVTGMWNQISGPVVTIVNPGSPGTTFIGTAGNMYSFQWSLSNGSCTNFSRDTIVITAQNPELANGGLDTFYCSPTGIRLNATQGITAQGQWTQSNQQAQLGVIIDNPSDPKTTISGNILPGQSYVFFWEIGNIGCGFSSDPVVIYIFSPKPKAGNNQFVCSNDGCTQLSASPLANFEVGTWSSSTPSVTFTNPNSPNTTVCGLQPGANTIFWTTNGGICGSNSRDTLEVFYEIFPTAENDFVTVPFGSATQFNVLLNDILPVNYTVTITTQPLSGAIIDNPSTGVYTYRPSSGFSGSDVMTYRVCNTQCPSACSFANVTFTVAEIPECFIPSIITPNGDGFNDVFTIPNACTVGEGATELDVTIFNQWGDVVFHAKPYQNDWGGTYNSEQLPAGTYYYVVRLYDNQIPKTGFLLIQR